ncbi:MAG: heavy metal translocating P-type ATPase [Huintestinicola sp.]
MNRKQKKVLIRILISLALLVAAMIIPADGWVKLVIFLIPYLIIGYDVLRKAGLNIIHGQIFDENFLMVIATIGAFATGDYAEGTAVMLFYQVGELFQSYAVSKSRKSISELMDIRPDYANVEDENGGLVQVDPEEIKIGGIIVVKPGEKIPLDGVVAEGNSTVDTSALTGESVPREVMEGSSVISGCINLSGLLKIRVEKEFGESTVSKILELVENSSEKKSKSENFISRFAKYYTPTVVICAVLLAVLPPLITGDGFAEWVKRALTFLVISCPCALVISVPLSFFGGIGGASKCGILIKGSNYLEALSKAGIVVFDKTGTLTKGSFEVSAVHSSNVSEDELLDLAAHAECYSDHPISRSLRTAYSQKGMSIDKSRVSEVEEIAGHGVNASIDGRKIHAGNMKLMKRIGADAHECHKAGTAVHVAADGSYCGHIIISDIAKPDSAEAIRQLKANGVKRTVMLTGDDKRVGEAVAKELGIDEYHAELLPGDKVDMLEKILSEAGKNEKVVFVGDGINDAPVLTRADIGIAMGALGSDAAIEAADVVLMDDNPLKIATAIKISRKTLSIVDQNIVFALGVKFAVLILGALGLANMWAAVFADVGVSVIAILNAMRALNTKKL